LAGAGKHVRLTPHRETLIMIRKPKLSSECLEQLDTWVCAHRVLDSERGEFLAGLWVIVEDEIERAVRRERALLRERLQLPIPQ
jgi:hypothetical protein